MLVRRLHLCIRENLRVNWYSWIGKTTTSCSLAIQLASCRESVLLIVRSGHTRQRSSADLQFLMKLVHRSSTQLVRCVWSEVFQGCDESQWFWQLVRHGDRPDKCYSRDGWAVWVLFNPILSNELTVFSSYCLADSNGMMGSMMQDLAFAIPGVDEAMSFAEIMKYVFPHFWLQYES